MLRGSSKSLRPGFSLAEIMIAIVIMGVIAAIVGPRVAGFLSGAKFDTAKQSLRGLKATIEHFNNRHGDYPDTLKDLYKKPANEELAKDWIEPYIEEKKIVDPWKNKFQYTKTPGQTHPYELFSYGPKGKSSGKSERIDVWSL